MCQSSPGPRCSPHAEQKWQRSQEKLAALRAEHAKITAVIDDAVNHTSHLSDEEIDLLRSKQQALQERIEDQIDKVSAEREIYWTTPKGRESLQAEIDKYRAENNLRAVHTLTVRLERAEEEHAYRVLAGKVASKEREHLKKTLPAGGCDTYMASTMEQRKMLRRDEVRTIGELEHWRQQLSEHRGNTREAQHARQQAHLVTARLKELQAARRSLEESDYARRAGIPGFVKASDTSDVKALSDGQHYLRLKSTDFGTARDHFPTGALVKISGSSKDEVGNTVVELETGDKRLIFSDSVVVRAAIS